MDDNRNEPLEEFQAALARNEEAAEVISWPVPWDVGAPTPMVVSSEMHTILIYLAGTPSARDGKSVVQVGPSDSNRWPLGVVTFNKCVIHKFGGPNDEVIEGHHLYGRGLDAYEAHVIHNSKWIAEQEAINRIHPRYNPAYSKDGRHYLLLFHDSIFECIAESYEVVHKEATFESALMEAVGQITS